MITGIYHCVDISHPIGVISENIILSLKKKTGSVDFSLNPLFLRLIRLSLEKLSYSLILSFSNLSSSPMRLLPPNFKLFIVQKGSGKTIAQIEQRKYDFIYRWEEERWLNDATLPEIQL